MTYNTLLVSTFYHFLWVWTSYFNLGFFAFPSFKYHCLEYQVMLQFLFKSSNMISKSQEERIIYCIYHIFALFCSFFLPDSPEFLLLSFPVCLRNFLCSVFKGRSASHNYFLFFPCLGMFLFSLHSWRTFLPYSEFAVDCSFLSVVEKHSASSLGSYFLNVKFAVAQTGASL